MYIQQMELSNTWKYAYKLDSNWVRCYVYTRNFINYSK